MRGKHPNSLGKTIIMNFISLTFVLFLFVFIKAQTCFQECKQLSFYECKICYNKCVNSQPQPKQLTIDHCEQTVKKSEGNTQIIILNQNQCISRCCQQSLYLPFTFETLDRCIIKNEILKTQQNVVAIVIFSSIGVGAFLIIAFRCLYAYCKKKSQDDEAEYSNDGAQGNEKILEWKNLEDKRQKLSSLCERNKNMQQNCSICLEPYCDCQTQCGHLYHIKCFVQWLKRDKICPDCRSLKIRPIQLICKRCRLMCLAVMSKEHMRQVKKLIQESRLNCDSCSNEGISRNESFEGGWVNNVND